MATQVDVLAVDQTVIQNIRRLMVKNGMDYEGVVEASGVDARTLNSVILGQQRPHARTIGKIAKGFGVDVDELFRPAANIRRRFDRATNAIVDEVVAAHSELFRDWTDADFDELYSSFGVGGQQTEAGVLFSVKRQNTVRELKHMVAIVMQSSLAGLLETMVRELYKQVTARPAVQVASA